MILTDVCVGDQLYYYIDPPYADSFLYERVVVEWCDAVEIVAFAPSRNAHIKFLRETGEAKEGPWMGRVKIVG